MRTPLAAATAVLLSAACATPPKPPPASASPAAARAAPVEVMPTGTRGQASAVSTRTVSGTVKSVDMATRTLTVTGKDGDLMFRIGAGAERVDEIFVGDAVQVDVQQLLLLEVQVPGSPAVPYTASGDGGIQATVTVTAVDVATRTVRFEDPAGAAYEVRAGPGLAIERLKTGDRLLATFVEANAIRLEKPPKRP